VGSGNEDMMGTSAAVIMDGQIKEKEETNPCSNCTMSGGGVEVARNAGNAAKTMAKTFNSGYSLVVTHLTTNPPVRCLNRAERTGSLVLNVLWSNVKESEKVMFITFTAHRPCAHTQTELQ
jgi:hypothetical protein